MKKEKRINAFGLEFSIISLPHTHLTSIEYYYLYPNKNSD